MLADERMYAAKEAGRNRYCFQKGPQLWCRCANAPAAGREKWAAPSLSQKINAAINVDDVPLAKPVQYRNASITDVDPSSHDGRPLKRPGVETW